MALVTVAREWDANERVTERGNRVYISYGRFQWLVLVDGAVDSAHDTCREAKARAAQLAGGGR